MVTYIDWRLCFGAKKMKLPASYFVVRDASLVRIRVHDADGLRRLRTELALLRRIHQLAAEWHSARRIDPKAGPSTDKYTTKERDELESILRDADHPIVEVMATQLDKEFRGIRKDIVMSVVNEEAENIVQESLESGVLGSDESQQQTGTLPPELDDALAQAEAELAKAISPTTETAPESPAQPEPDPVAAVAPPPPEKPAQQQPEPPVAADVSQPQEAPVSTDGPKVEEVAAQPAPSPSEPAIEATSAPVELSVPQPAPEPAPTTSEAPVAAPVVASKPAPEPATSSEPVAQPVPAVASEPAAATPEPSEPYTPQHAEQAVVEIEKGIRKLAAVLSTEVSDQWQRAKNAVDETTVSRAKTDEASGQAQALVKAITKLKEEAASALDEINLVRREAKLLREDTKRAKQRADASADAAQLAADQVQREAESTRTTPA